MQAFCLLCAFLLGLMPLLLAQGSATKPLRMGVAGLTHTHVHGILGRADRGDIEIVGIAEANQDLAARYAKQHGFSLDLVYPSLEEMLEATRPEAVAAFNPIFEHLAVVEACAPRGIHVMVEKPLAVSLAHAQKMSHLAHEHQIHLLTNYETTWYGSNHELYQMVHGQHAIGDIRKLVIHDGHPGPIEIGCNEEFLYWLTDPVQNGAGALTDFGCYGANLMTWLMQGQRPLTVTAITQQIKPDKYPKVDDEATIILTYPQAQGIIQASWNWPVNRKDTHVYGQWGYVHALDGQRLRIRLTEDSPEKEKMAAPLPPEQNDPFAYFYGVVRGQIQPQADLSSLENNLIVMEILDAAMRAAKSGKTISLSR